MIAIVDYGMANLRSVEKGIARVGGSPVITSDPKVIEDADQVVLPGVGAFCASITNLKDYGLQEAVLNAIKSGKPFLGICVGLQMLFESSSEMGSTPGLGILKGHVVKFFQPEESLSGSPEDNNLRSGTMEQCSTTIGESSSFDTKYLNTQQPTPNTQYLTPEHHVPDTRHPTPDTLSHRALKVPHIGWNSIQFPRPSRLLNGLPDGSRVYFVHSYYPDPADKSLITATTDYGSDFCCAVEIDNVAATQFHPEKSGAVGLQILRNFVNWN